MTTAKPLHALCLVLIWPACQAASDEKLSFVVDLHARSTLRDPLADVRFWADGRELGVTDPRGNLRAQLVGRDGQVVALSVACPPAYRTHSPQRRLVLQRLAGRTTASSSFELTAECEPLERIAAVVVRTRGDDVAGLPIRVGGETVGQTELDGSAHLLLHARPHSSLRVEIATDAYPQLLPRDPIQTFQLGDEDSIFVVDQTFAETKPATPRSTLHQAHHNPLRRPYRLDSH